jgi:hypothetical protein
LYTIESNLAIVSCFHASQKAMAVRILQSTRALLEGLAKNVGPSPSLEPVAIYAVDKLKVFLDEMIEGSTDHDVLRESVMSMIQLCRVHHQLRDKLKAMHNLLTNDKLDDDIKQLARDEIATIMAAAEMVISGSPIAVGAVSAGQIDPTPECCILLNTLLVDACDRLERRATLATAELTAAEAMTMSRELYGPSALLSLSIEAAASQFVSGIPHSVLDGVRKVHDFAATWLASKLPDWDAFDAMLSNLLRATVMAVNPTQHEAALLFFDVQGQTSASASVIRVAALESVVSPEVAFRMVTCSSSPHSSLARLEALLAAAFADGPQITQVQRVVALHQIELARHAEKSPELLTIYTATLCETACAHITASITKFGDNWHDLMFALRDSVGAV